MQIAHKKKNFSIKKLIFFCYTVDNLNTRAFLVYGHKSTSETIESGPR